MNFKNVIAFIALIATTVGAAACGAPSPAAPSQFSSSSTSTNTSVTAGATINGSITGPALSAVAMTGSGFATLNGPGSLLVGIVGTTITTSVKPNGTFVLTDVPPGDIQLRFSGPGTDALLTVTGVAGGDELLMTVQVSGSTATLQELSRKDKVNKVEVEGAVISGTCASFIVGATTIITDAATQFSKGTCASVIPGAIVQVKGATQLDGTVRATDVKFKTGEEDEDGDDEQTKLELEGIVTAGACGSFTVKDVTVTTDAATVFKNGRCEEIAVGVRVHVRATLAGLATLVNIQRDADDNGKSGDREDGEENEDESQGGGNGRGKGKK